MNICSKHNLIMEAQLALKALTGLKKRSLAVPELINLLGNNGLKIECSFSIYDKNYFSEEDVFKLFGQVKAKESIPILKRIILSDGGEYYRHLAKVTLDRVLGKEEKLKNGKNINSLTKFKPSNPVMKSDLSLNQELISKSVQKFIKILEDATEDWKILQNAAYQLGNFNAIEAIPVLIHTLNNYFGLLEDWYEVEELREEVAEALCKISPETAISELIKILQNEWEPAFFKTQIAKLLIQIKAKTAIPEIFKTIFDKNAGDEHYRGDILTMFCEMHTKEIIPYLVKILRNIDLDEDFREFVAAPLIDMNVKEVIPDLIEIASNYKEEGWFRKDICRTLSKTIIGKENYFYILLGMKSNKNDFKILKLLCEILFFNTQNDKEPFYFNYESQPLKKDCKKV